MKRATDSFLREIEMMAQIRKHQILNAADAQNVRGCTYYVSNQGDDANDGKSPASAWQTLARVSEATLSPGDAVFFCRGDLFRGYLKTAPGVTYAAYGEGEKPRFYGWEKDLADPALWELSDAAHHIWHLKEKILDCGT